MAAALTGLCAALTTLPVIGIPPTPSSAPLDGVDAAHAGFDLFGGAGNVCSAATADLGALGACLSIQNRGVRRLADRSSRGDT